jgi:hypothetical protein
MPLSSNIGINLGDGPPSLIHRGLSREELWEMNSAVAKASSSLVIADSEQRLKSIIGKLKLFSLPVERSISGPKRKGG